MAIIPRLPVPGSDDGTWGELLNAFLGVEHNADGTLKRAAVIASAAADSDVVHNTGDESIAGAKTLTSRLVISEPGAGTATLALPDTTGTTGITFGGDTNLFRSGVGQLQTASALFAVRATLGVVAIGVTTSGDATRRFQINTDGKLLWSAGSGSQDTSLVRDTGGGLKLTATTGTTGSPATPGLSVVQNGVSSSSTSGGGTMLVNNATNPGSALVVYSNAGSGSSGRLVNIRSNNAAFDQPALHVDYSGTAAGVEILHSGTGSVGNALNITSTNQNDSSFGISGTEIAKGTIKAVHNYPGVSDATASALSLRANGTGTAAQGIFFDAEDGGTTGNLMKMRNGGADKFIMSSNGGLYTGANIQVGSTVQDFGGGSIVVGLKDAAAAPSTNPTGGVIIYSEGSVLKYRNASGSVFSIASSGADANPQPNDQGYKGWAYDPTIAANSTAPASGQPVLIKIKAAASGTVNTVDCNVNTAGSGFTASASFAAVYSLSGTLLAQSGDLAATFGSTGAKAIALGSGVSVTAGTFYYVWLVVNATSPPALSRGGNVGVINQGTGPGTYRFCTLGSSISSPPASLTLGSSAALSTSYWVALS